MCSVTMGRCGLVVMHRHKDGQGLVETLISDLENVKHVIIVDPMLRCASRSLMEVTVRQFVELN